MSNRSSRLVTDIHKDIMLTVSLFADDNGLSSQLKSELIRLVDKSLKKNRIMPVVGVDNGSRKSIEFRKRTILNLIENNPYISVGQIAVRMAYPKSTIKMKKNG